VKLRTRAGLGGLHLREELVGAEGGGAGDVRFWPRALRLSTATRESHPESVVRLQSHWSDEVSATSFWHSW
jgi:hypothetical protein